MEPERIDEPIRVLADCAGGELHPLRFRWLQRTYKVDAVNARWIDRKGEIYSLHYSVQADGQTYFIHFDSSGVQWWLDETIIA